MICAHDFPREEVSVKVGVMEFGLYAALALHDAYQWLMNTLIVAKYFTFVIISASTA